jgi:hypothetical protein
MHAAQGARAGPFVRGVSLAMHGAYITAWHIGVEHREPLVAPSDFARECRPILCRGGERHCVGGTGESLARLEDATECGVLERARQRQRERRHRARHPADTRRAGHGSRESPRFGDVRIAASSSRIWRIASVYVRGSGNGVSNGWASACVYHEPCEQQQRGDVPRKTQWPTLAGEERELAGQRDGRRA